VTQLKQSAKILIVKGNRLHVTLRIHSPEILFKYNLFKNISIILFEEGFGTEDAHISVKSISYFKNLLIDTTASSWWRRNTWTHTLPKLLWLWTVQKTGTLVLNQEKESTGATKMRKTSISYDC